jgi:hypothetical protein
MSKSRVRNNYKEVVQRRYQFRTYLVDSPFLLTLQRWHGLCRDVNKIPADAIHRSLERWIGHRRVQMGRIMEEIYGKNIVWPTLCIAHKVHEEARVNKMGFYHRVPFGASHLASRRLFAEPAQCTRVHVYVIFKIVRSCLKLRISVDSSSRSRNSQNCSPSVKSPVGPNGKRNRRGGQARLLPLSRQTWPSAA